ncbi:DEAD/DEAH box helicase [Endozoicomonas numazuensis]|uniref:DEAD-box ATP-dependent RNA helicase RhpA n=1 Tax=Endozoicomonas numazuensis TaxID=1137799 RepID=A0A081NEN5_9GAMM|nr:DEAD/DEAH box helicase [Endozoicomonas numazuensis]KEQ16908.1 DEAD/DEAH box helicase [Endozoicomonas numazuensis]
MGFSSLGLLPSLIHALNEHGYEQPTPIQQAAIPAVLAGKDVMAGAQTGTGKTAAFALPVLQQLMNSTNPDSETSPVKAVKALVLTPTRELAQQVHRSFETYRGDSSLTTALAYGGVSLNPQLKALQSGADILVATPGRLLDLMQKKAVDLSTLQHLIFDEADRMLDMGFITDIQRIMKKIPSDRQTLLFSATFNDEVFSLSKTLLKQPELIEVDARNTAATSVEQMVYVVDEDRKRELLSYMIGSKNWHQVLIFVRTKQGADALAKEMKKDGIEAVAIHGDKSQGARERGLAEFKEGKIRALIATDVASRGLDIQQLQYVVNYELPYIAEDYIHRIGRTGRAGSHGLAISMISLGEEYLLEEIEAILDNRLPQSWYPGYEPDLTKPIPSNKKNSRTAQKQRAKDRAFGKKTGNRRRRPS